MNTEQRIAELEMRVAKLEAEEKPIQTAREIANCVAEQLSKQVKNESFSFLQTYR